MAPWFVSLANFPAQSPWIRHAGEDMCAKVTNITSMLPRLDAVGLASGSSPAIASLPRLSPITSSTADSTTGNTTEEASDSANASSPMLCMLTVVHEPDFDFLAARLALQAHFLRGPQPSTVAVFDDLAALDAFCSHARRMPAGCGNHPSSTGDATTLTHPLALSSLLGNETYSWLRHSLFGSSPAFPRAGSLNSLGCILRTSGRVYQSIKKIYGVMHGP